MLSSEFRWVIDHADAVADRGHGQVDPERSRQLDRPESGRQHHRIGRDLRPIDLDPGDSSTVHDQPSNRSGFTNLHPASASGSGIGMRDFQRIAIAGAWFPGGNGDIAGRDPGVDFCHRLGIHQCGVDAERALHLHVERQRFDILGRHQHHQARLIEGGRYPKSRFDVLEELHRAQRHARKHFVGVVLANLGARPLGRARGDSAAVEQHHPARAALGQLPGDARPGRAPSDHHHIGRIAGHCAPFPAGSITRLPETARCT